MRLHVICKTMKEDFAPYLADIMPFIQERLESEELIKFNGEDDEDVEEDAEKQAFFQELDVGALPSLVELNLHEKKLGWAVACALAVPLKRGALPKLEKMYLGINHFGNVGVAALLAEWAQRRGATLQMEGGPEQEGSTEHAKQKIGASTKKQNTAPRARST